MSAGHAFVRVLEEDPELAAGLDPTSVQLATRHAIAAVEIVAPGVYTTFDNTALYRSADGLQWTRIVPRPEH